MPLYAGSVHSLLERQNLTVREIVKYGLGFLSGLHHVHVRGLVHLDVKPSNVLIDHADRAALADFGLAKRVDAHGLAEQDIMYRPHRVPEALIGSKVGAPADIYQAGLTLYRMAIGGTSLDEQWARFGADDQAAYRAVLRGELPDRSNAAFPAHIPANLRRLIRRALEVDPDARFGTVLELLGDLAKVDQYLDWRYEDDGAGTERWTKTADDREDEITAVDDGIGITRVSVTTRRLDTGAVTKRHKLAGTAKTRTAAAKLVHTAMEELE
jgi:serine/threonine protein kinase